MVLPILRRGRRDQRELAKAIQRGCCRSPLPTLLELTARGKGQPVAKTDTHPNTAKTPHRYSRSLLSGSGRSLQLASDAGEGRYKSWRQREKWLTSCSGYRSPQPGYTLGALGTLDPYTGYTTKPVEKLQSPLLYLQRLQGLFEWFFFSMHSCLKGRRAFESSAPDLWRSQRFPCSWGF